MNSQSLPATKLSLLHRADGSASYSRDGYSIVGAVNGPVEAQRRDELAEEAAVDVTVRPSSGVGGPRERHLESILQSTLRQVILVQKHPRMVVQVTLQVVATPESRSTSISRILPALLHTSMLSLLSASIPLSTVLSSAVVAIDHDGQILSDAPARQLDAAASLHVFAFSSQQTLLLAESEGGFDLDGWEAARETARSMCCGESAMDDHGQADTLEAFLRLTMRAKVEGDQRWKEGGGFASGRDAMIDSEPEV
ncbi:MAG: exosome non-catalytic core subunit rrp46 [Thelocarpon impressellum]|nr:MAG: exosome non-catalytic core subunit rrp46 [Thelocarpon impressellum]